MTSPQLVEQPITDLDWQHMAWQRLAKTRDRYHDLTVQQALDDPSLGRIVRGFAAQLKRDHEALQEHQTKQARYGTKVQHNGYGYRPVQRKTTR